MNFFFSFLLLIYRYNNFKILKKIDTFEIALKLNLFEHHLYWTTQLKAQNSMLHVIYQSIEYYYKFQIYFYKIIKVKLLQGVN